MAFFVSQFAVLMSFLFGLGFSSPVIKSSPQIFSSKLDQDVNSWDWQQQRRLLSSLIDTGELPHLASSTVSTLSTSSDEKNRSKSEKTRDSLKPNHQPRRRDESPRGFSPELFQFFKQYGVLTRLNEQRSDAGLRIIFPARRGKQFDKIDVVQKIADSSEEDDGNVQKIDRKEKPEETMTVEAYVEEEVDDGGEELIDEDLRGNGTEIETMDGDNEQETIMQKIRQTDYFAIIYLGGFIGLVAFFFILACSEIFCSNCLYRSSSNLFLPQAHCAHSYYTTPKPATPPPPYHLFAPPQYIDCVRDERGKQCACTPATPCPPYSRERTPRSQTDRTDLVSIIHIEDNRPAYQVSPLPFLNIRSDDKRNTESEKIADSGIFQQISTDPILCPSRKQEYQSSPPLPDENIRQSISFVEYSTGKEPPSFKTSASFNDRYLDLQSLLVNNEKPMATSQSSPLSKSTEKVNDTEKIALSDFIKNNQQFRNELKCRIRNSVSFSSSQNCSDQLGNQCKHSVSYTEQIDNIDSASKSNLKQHSSCFSIGSLRPELIQLGEGKVIGSLNQRTDVPIASNNTLPEDLLDSDIRLTTPFSNEDKLDDEASTNKTELDPNTKTSEKLVNAWNELESTHPINTENLNAKIFFINDNDDDDDDDDDANVVLS